MAVDIENKKNNRWRIGVLAGIAVVLIAMIPQMRIWITRGEDWQGSYAATDPDELAYSAYLASIIAHRTRRNNPYLERDTDSQVTKENLFSIQFFPAYTLGMLARLVGISASTAFLWLTPLCAFASSMALFWLLASLTRDNKLAAIGVLFVLLCGGIISENPLAAEKHYYTLAFLRRYVPALPFPLLFLFCGFVLRAFSRPEKRSRLWSAAAGLTFIVFVYSYFYLWTGIGAWLLCFASAWALVRPADRNHIISCLLIIGIFAAAALVPYFYLLSHRAETTEITYALVRTRAPDLFRSTEILGAIILAAIGWRFRQGAIKWTSPVVLFAASCCVVPFVVFNQQVITGRSLQPFHYEQFIVNYLIMIAVVLSYCLISTQPKKRAFLWICLALGVGLGTALRNASIASQMNLRRDEALPVYRKLNEYSKHGGSAARALFSEDLLGSNAPTSSSVSLLWSSYIYTFGSMTAAEERERFYQYLYYLGVSSDRFKKELKEDRLHISTLFGQHRVNRKLSESFRPVSEEELDAQAKSYSTYVNGFSREQANRWPLTFVIIDEEHSGDLSNLDHWYERDAGELIGKRILYRVWLRQDMNQ